MLGHKRGQCNASPTPIRVKDEEFDEPVPGHVTEQLAALNIDQDEANNIRLCISSNRQMSEVSPPLINM